LNLIKSNYAAIVKAGSASLPKYYRVDEVKAIIDACDRCGRMDLALIIDFLWKTGARVSELISIKYKDINLYDKQVRVITLKKSRRKTKGRKPSFLSERVIPLPDELLNRINARRIETQAGEGDLVFPFSRETAFRKVRKACELAGLNDERAHPHAFRHSYAIHLLRSGVPIAAVQRLLGHSSIENTAIYLAIVQSDIEAFVRNVSW